MSARAQSETKQVTKTAREGDPNKNKNTDDKSNHWSKIQKQATISNKQALTLCIISIDPRPKLNQHTHTHNMYIMLINLDTYFWYKL